MTRQDTAKVLQYIVHHEDLAGDAERALLEAAARELVDDVVAFGAVPEITKIPAPPAPFAPIPYPNTSGGSRAYSGLGPGLRSVFGHIRFTTG